MKNFFKSPKDERVQAEVNNIYRIGYLVLMFGIFFDLFLQFTADFGKNEASIQVRPVEFIVFLTANALCMILMLRKGIGDDSPRYAEADTFPRLHYMLISVSGAFISAILFAALQVRALINQEVSDIALIVLFTCGSIFILTAPAIYAIQYLCFRLAKRRRKELEQEFDKDDE